MSERILILGCGVGEIPLVESARRRGLDVITCGADETGLAHTLADEQIYVDYSDPILVSRVFEQVGARYLVAGANDFAQVCGSQIAQRMNLRNFDSPHTTSLLHRKDKFRELGKRLGLPQPRHLTVSEWSRGNLIGQLDFPLIVKPADLTGGKGIAVAETESQVPPALMGARQSSRAQEAVVEEYLSGTQHGYSTVVSKGQIVFEFLDIEFYGRNPFLVSGTATPISDASRLSSELRPVAARLAQHLDLVDGPLHFQFVKTAQGPRVIEVCRRLPGDLYPWFMRLSTGVDLSQIAIDNALGLTPTIEPIGMRPILRKCLMADSNGIIASIPSGSSLGPFMPESIIWGQSGHLVSEFLVQKQGIVFVEASSNSELQDFITGPHLSSDFQIETQPASQFHETTSAQ